MKKYFLFFVILLFCSPCFANEPKDSCISVRVKKLKTDRTTYTIQGGRTYYNYIVKIDLINNCPNTICFWQMSCSWQNAFFTNNDKLYLLDIMCDLNKPQLYKIEPGKSISYQGILQLKVESHQLKNLNFRVGFIYLKEQEENRNEPLVQTFYKMKKEKRNVIWSDEVHFKTGRHKKANNLILP